MKILFVIKHVEYIDPMGVMLLSALARRKGHRTHLHALSDGDVGDAVRRVAPDVVAYSAMTGEHKYYLAANEVVKRHGRSIFTIMGGPHPTFHPDVIDGSDLDALCRGEGFDAWPELLEALESGRSVDSIPNIVTRGNQGDRSGRRLRDRREELDDLPFYDRELVYRNTRLGSFGLRCFMSSYGCPYACAYCFNREYNHLYVGKGRLYRRLSVDRVCEELAALKRDWPTQFIKFYDDVFTLDADRWLETFAEEYPRRVGLPFHCLVRADNVARSPRILELLKRAGLVSISMSIESGNAHIRESVLKRRMTEQDLSTAFRRCQELGIATFSNTILAVPVAPEVMRKEGKSAIDYDIESVDFNIRCGVVFGEFPLLTPYPGTRIDRIARSAGTFDGDYSRLHMNYHNLSPFDCFTPREKKLQKNLSLLGLLCLLFPGSRLQRFIRNLVVNHLIHLPRGDGRLENWLMSRVYYVLFWVAKVYLVKTRIYPMRFSLAAALKNLVISFRLELFKRSDEER
ncbi:MAG: B12-binding domain-containing radical SAM protein [Candidatus Riflebacteria bacterium]|nr:B12-binding domain-containing radical SAM protein [Candidatus Riflebacteria bacterium]